MNAYQEYKYKWLIEHGYTLAQVKIKGRECNYGKQLWI